MLRQSSKPDLDNMS